MFVKQLSVFIENRQGRLEKVTEVLKQEGINIVSLSLADSLEYGVLRMIVSDPEKAKAILKKNDFSAMLTDVLAVKLPHEVGMLQNLLNVLSGSSINIEYMYALATGKDNASMIVKADDQKKAEELINASSLVLYGEEEAYRIND